MAVYVVTYDLNNEDVRPKILDGLSGYEWAQLSESCYAISTSETASEVYAGFVQYLDDDDQFYVIRLTQPIDGQGPEEVNEWLQARL